MIRSGFIPYTPNTFRHLDYLVKYVEPFVFSFCLPLAARRGARAVELHPAAAPRPARNRRRPVARSLGPFTDVNNVLA